MISLNFINPLMQRYGAVGAAGIPAPPAIPCVVPAPFGRALASDHAVCNPRGFSNSSLSPALPGFCSSALSYGAPLCR